MLLVFKSLLCFIADIQEAQIRGGNSADEAGGGLVVPLLLQNAPPILEGRKDDELADLELRPEQVREMFNWNYIHACLIY